MTDVKTARSWIADALRDAGLDGRGSVWRRVGTGVQWVVEIDRPPFGRRLGIDVGLDLQTDSTPTGPTDCPILLHLENMPVAKDIWVTKALDMDSRLTDDERRHNLESAARGLTAYLGERLTLDSARAVYRDGEFKSGLIHWRVRPILDS